MFGVNTYILWDDTTNDAAIIDPGMINQTEQDLVDNFIKQIKPHTSNQYSHAY